MSITQAIICGIIYWLAEANLPFVGLWTLQRPLVCGFLTGCVLGDPVTGRHHQPGLPGLHLRRWLHAC